MSDVHEVFAVRYGHHDRPAHENYINGDPHDTLEPLAYFVWVIRGRSEARWWALAMLPFALFAPTLAAFW